MAIFYAIFIFFISSPDNLSMDYGESIYEKISNKRLKNNKYCMKTTQLLDFKLSISIYAMKNTSKMLLFFKLKLSDINLCNKN